METSATVPPARTVGARLRRWLQTSYDRPPLLPPSARPWAWRLALAGFALAILTLPISGTVRFSAESGWWWERGFDAHDAARRTGLDRAEVDRAGAALRAYFQSDAARADITVTAPSGRAKPLFSEREVLHLIDVKRLLERTYDAGWAAIGVIVAFVAGGAYWCRPRAARALAHASRLAGLSVAAAVGLLAVVAATGFDEAFRQFHLLFFTNDLWQLSSSDRLIQMFPQRFFFQTTLLIGGVTIALAAALALAGWAWLRRHPDGPPARTDGPAAPPGSPRRGRDTSAD